MAQQDQKYINPRGQYDLLVKILMVGDSGVGKTALLNQFVDGCFTQNFISTIGIDFKIKVIEMDGIRIKLQLWDTAGQERFFSITQAYFRGADGVMLVYDVNKPHTFDGMCNKWIRCITDTTPDVCKMVVGNKIDQAGPNYKAVPTDKGRKLASLHNAGFWETSAKQNVNVSDSFMELVRTIKDKKMAQKELAHLPLALRGGSGNQEGEDGEGRCCR